MILNPIKYHINHPTKNPYLVVHPSSSFSPQTSHNIASNWSFTLVNSVKYSRSHHSGPPWLHFASILPLPGVGKAYKPHSQKKLQAKTLFTHRKNHINPLKHQIIYRPSLAQFLKASPPPGGRAAKKLSLKV